MPVTLNGQTYCQTAEACARAAISKNTFLRWVRQGTFPDVRYRDRKGWRLFSSDDVERLRARVQEVRETQQS
ncbi:MAG: DNA-binding protein [Dehalococcoidia bacterium]|nr:MAG: DNA-binding protein [Dehalococcoidia bacterium]